MAYDFSPGADRALRRATLLAKASHAAMVLAHAASDTVPGEAEGLLSGLAETVRSVDGVACEVRIRKGRAPETIAALSLSSGADLIVTGPPRPEGVRNLFVGTTAGRSVKHAQAPVLVAAGVPAHPYRRALFATDLSQNSAAAAAAVRRLGLLENGWLAALYAFAAPAEGLMFRTPTTRADQKAYMAEEAGHARRELQAFLDRSEISTDELLAEPIDVDAAQTVRAVARRLRADLIVIGARGRSTLETLLLGSVATALLATADRDIFIAPPARNGSP
ncbi:universal stress protein [Phenylobacterium sp.]|uniref:universal stress protein n=1 Tax=Phenylobacterium sp. TaxID=1871053 RepID=UPI003BAC8992